MAAKSNAKQTAEAVRNRLNNRANPAREALRNKIKTARSGGSAKSKAAKSGSPKVLTKKGRSASRNTSSLAKKAPSKSNGTKRTRHKSASGSAPKVNIAGRHVPNTNRYKTGYWRPVRQSWMSNEVWEAFKAINRFRNKTMSKGLGAASLGKKIFGKEGPGHPGYGTGQLQKWADKMLRQGNDPHMIDLTKWFAGVAAALDYHSGERSFEHLVKDMQSDTNHFMRDTYARLKRMVPEFRNLSKTAVDDLIKHKYYTAQYGPDGRAK